MMLDINNLNHEAIYRAYPNVVSIGDGLGAFDQDGNQVELDEAAIDAVAGTVRLERAWEFLRNERNARMAETDWWANSDVTMTDEQRTYRQALRDLPSNTTDPENPVWPTKP